MARTGRRPGASVTREAIARVAREQFGRQGYDATTIRGIAAEAGVDPALVHHYFGSKESVFVEVMRLPFRPSDLVGMALAEGLDGVGERLVRAILRVFEHPASRDGVLGMVRSAVSNERAAAMLREFMGQEAIGRLAAAIGGPDAQLRGALVLSQMVGVGMLRYILRVEPLASADPEQVVTLVAPVLQRYLTDQGPGAHVAER